jgi:hypothetical protein
MQCIHCGELVPYRDNNRPPPWCPNCGADIGLESLVPLPSSSPCLSVLSAPGPQPREEASSGASAAIADSAVCPACLLALDTPEGQEDCVLSCPECGQCLRVPPSWVSAAPVEPRILGSVTVPVKNKLPGWCSLVLGSIFAAPLWFFPSISLFARLALTMLGAALLAEGLGRLRTEAERRQPRRRVDSLPSPDRMAEGVAALGGLRAVFRTGPNRGTDALAIALFGLAFACGEGYIVELLLNGAANAKLFLAAIAAPIAAGYTLYRAARYYFDHWCVLIFSEGLVCFDGRRIDVHFRETIAGVSQMEIGDAIDERSVEIRLKSGKPPLRFTCSHFHNLDYLGERVRREFSRPSGPRQESSGAAACFDHTETQSGSE